MEVFNFYAKGAGCGVRAFSRVNQRVKYRIAVETRQAAPDDTAAFVDQRAKAAVADDRHGQRRRFRRAEMFIGGGSCHEAHSWAADCSQLRSSAGLLQRCSAAVAPSPTLIP